MSITVKNIQRSSDKSCNCSSWIKHWEHFTGKRALVCAALGCAKTDIVGAHVRRTDLHLDSHYIVPFCSEHNKETGEIQLSETQQLVSANKQLTCEA